MALSGPFSIGPEQGEVDRNVGLLIGRRVPRRLSLQLSAGAAAAHHAAGAHGPRAGAARVAGGGSVRLLSRTASGVAGQGALLLALAAPAVFIDAVGGQNSTWTAALFGGGLSPCRVCSLNSNPTGRPVFVCRTVARSAVIAGLVRTSAVGTFPTSPTTRSMSVHGGKADSQRTSRKRRE